jgi:DNA polymerase-3 subunit beta
MDSKRLATILELVKPVCNSRSCLPILSHVHLSNNGQAVWTATDLEFGIRITTESIGEDCEVAIPAGKLLDIVKASGGDIIIHGLSDTGALTLESGRGQVKVATMEAQDFPCFLESWPSGLTVRTTDLIEQFENVLTASSKDKSRFNLNTVYCDGPNAKIVGTDGRRLATADVGWLPETVKALIPRGGLDKAVKAMKKVKKECPEVEIAFDLDGSRGNIIFLVGELAVITIRLTEGDYPSYEKVIPKTNSYEAIRFKTSEFMRALRQVRLLTSDRNKGITISFQGVDQVHLNAEHPDLGEAHVWFDGIDYDWASDDFIVDVDLLIDAVKKVKEDNFLLYPSKDFGPLMVNDSLIMPMRAKGKKLHEKYMST